eukprot:scaffold8134_cov334-Pinguiococcus_pyrenoidosus.AAC.1
MAEELARALGAKQRLQATGGHVLPLFLLLFFRSFEKLVRKNLRAKHSVPPSHVTNAFRNFAAGFAPQSS